MAVPVWLQRTYWSLAAFGLVYVLLIVALTIPVVQRNATYAHNVNPAMWQNLSNVEQYGFLPHQVQPFTITTPDNVTLFAWHILPVHLYKKHEAALLRQPAQVVEPYNRAYLRIGLQLLLNDPKATLVVSFHGNAAHLASAQRPATYQSILGLSNPENPVHVIAFDYRGFGLSGGSPTEEGIALDAVSILSAITGYDSETSLISDGDSFGTTSMFTKGVDPSRIVLVGQSLGTFVSTLLYHEWTIRLQRPAFRGLVLIAAFTSLTKLLDSYSIKGITPPMLSPLMGYPKAQNWILSKIVDKWETQRRLVELVQNPEIPLDLTLMHARDDWEIPWIEGRGNWNAIMNAVGAESSVKQAKTKNVEDICLQTWASEDGTKSVRWELVLHGGHNKVPTSEHAKLAILRLIEKEKQV